MKVGNAKSWGLPLSFLFGCQEQVNARQAEAGELMCLCQLRVQPHFGLTNAIVPLKLLPV